MPLRSALPCRKCKVATKNGNGYCDDHQSLVIGWSTRKSAWQGKGSTRSQRKERTHVFNRDHYLCQPCVRRGIYTVATQVDHIKNMAAGGTDTICNKQAICDKCHKIKTAQESNKG